MGVKIFEHRSKKLYQDNDNKVELCEVEFQNYSMIKPRIFPNRRNKEQPCFKLAVTEDSVYLEADYYIGLDWLIVGQRYVQVLPKVNSQIIASFEENLKIEETVALIKNDDQSSTSDPKLDEHNFKELDYLKMFMDAMSHPVIAKHTNGLIFIDWDSKEIEIEQKDDILTPFLIVQFLNLLKQIVRKGLKKSYYKVQEHLNNRVKGKILVSANIKNNVLRNRLTKTYCEYQEFGVDSTENRFLKKVLYFVQHYAVSNHRFFEGCKYTINQMIGYCSPAFEPVSECINEYELKHIRNNPFFKEYKEAIKTGQYILKRFAYNISNTSKVKINTPPFWIDMPELFELYVYHHLLTVFEKSEVKYHLSTFGNELDFLITKEGKKMVVDAKYKLHYKASHIHNDIRQVSGYARLKKVYAELGMNDSDELIDCLIVYPDNSLCNEDYKINIILEEANEIKAYKRVYKIGIPVRWI